MAIGGYFYFTGEPQDSSSGLTSEGISDPQVAQQVASADRILSLLNQVNSINIDPEFFKSTVFRSLFDRAVNVPEQPVGRKNPFVPIPGTFVSEPTPVR